MSTDLEARQEFEPYGTVCSGNTFQSAARVQGI